MFKLLILILLSIIIIYLISNKINDNTIELFDNIFKSDNDISIRDKKNTKHKLIKKDDNLTKKNDNLTKKNDNLTKKDDNLTKKDDNLTKKDDNLTKKDDNLTKKDDNLTKKDDNLTKKDDNLTKKEYDKIFNELLNESFTEEPIIRKLIEPSTCILKPINNRISYQADVDFFCPQMLETNLYYIIPYDLTKGHIRKELINMLNSEWENYSDEFILSNWQNQDIFYVLVSNIEDSQGEFIGTIAIDRKMFYPFISQLYINKKYRSLGYAKILIDFANQYIKSMGFDESRLWCDEELIPFYKKLGWIIEKMSDNKYVMVKSF